MKILIKLVIYMIFKASVVIFLISLPTMTIISGLTLFLILYNRLQHIWSCCKKYCNRNSLFVNRNPRVEYNWVYLKNNPAHRNFTYPFRGYFNLLLLCYFYFLENYVSVERICVWKREIY